MEKLLEKFNLLTFQSGMCPICKIELVKNQYMKTLFCNHFFHVECFFNYLENNNIKSCPICEAEQPIDFYLEYLTALGISNNAEEQPNFIDFKF